MQSFAMNINIGQTMKHSTSLDSLLDFDMAEYMHTHEDIYNAVRHCIVEDDGKDLIAVLSASLEVAKRIYDQKGKEA